MAHIALGVTGGIGAYKAVEVARGLQERGHEVTAVMTRNATRFVGSLTFEAITRRPVVLGQFARGANADIEHIALASSIDLLLVAPLTANVAAKFAHGLADDFLSALFLATQAPVLVAPAMNTHMWNHPMVRENLERLTSRGVRVVEPGEGFLACGWMGKGRLAEPAAIVEAAARLLAQAGASLEGRRLLVTAGPTFEDLDPVRFIANRSSGRMGIAIAEEARAQGAAVTLILGPTHLAAPAGVDVVRVRSAADMHAAVMERYEGADAIVMAAAVADYTPASVAADKMAKQPGGLTLALTRTRDILADLGERRGAGSRPLLVGFAAETSDVVAKARAKLERKRVDMILANDVSRADSGFAVDRNTGVLITRDDEQALAPQAKRDMAKALVARIAGRLGAAS